MESGVIGWKRRSRREACTDHAHFPRGISLEHTRITRLQKSQRFPYSATGQAACLPRTHWSAREGGPSKISPTAPPASLDSPFFPSDIPQPAHFRFLCKPPDKLPFRICIERAILLWNSQTFLLHSSCVPRHLPTRIAILPFCQISIFPANICASTPEDN